MTYLLKATIDFTHCSKGYCKHCSQDQRRHCEVALNKALRAPIIEWRPK